MTNKKLLITYLFLLLTAGCGATVKGLEGEEGLDDDIVKEAEYQFCSRGQSLKPLKNGTEVLFSELDDRSKVFAFTSGTSKCIINSNINDTWEFNGAELWFNLNPNSANNCLENNSLWEVVDSTTNGGFGQHYYLKNFKHPDHPLMEMNAHQAVRGTYARDRVGLQVWVCTNNN